MKKKINKKVVKNALIAGALVTAGGVVTAYAIYKIYGGYYFVSDLSTGVVDVIRANENISRITVRGGKVREFIFKTINKPVDSVSIVNFFDAEGNNITHLLK